MLVIFVPLPVIALVSDDVLMCSSIRVYSLCLCINNHSLAFQAVYLWSQFLSFATPVKYILLEMCQGGHLCINRGYEHENRNPSTYQHCLMQ